MKAVFDDSAELYDVEFTNSPIGKLQRKLVWEYLERKFFLDGMKVLELNCGTGEDAVFFAKHNCNVLATDVSRKMLQQTQRKIIDHQLQDNISSLWLDLNEMELLGSANKFDLIFSNFGGINCIEETNLKQLLNAAKSLLNKNGRMVLVLMPKFCLWETVYFSSKLQFKKAFRRNTQKAVKANVGDEEMNIWYYNRKNLNALTKDFKIVHSQPIGFALPPSYFNNTWLAKSRILNTLNAVERRLNGFSFLSNYADHFLIDLQLK
jgi:cyclopropane fatty-acyl-phospholipid synthase-like methyltransferase